MIAAYLIGDQQLVERLRTLASVVNSDLVPGITRLGVDLQGKLQQGGLGSQLLPSRDQLRELSTELSVEQSGGTITASIRIDRQSARKHGPARAAVFRASLRHDRAAFFRPSAEKAVRPPPGDWRSGLLGRSFLRSALDSMTPTVRDSVEATLEEAVSQ
jgi:hypothetical protein